MSEHEESAGSDPTIPGQPAGHHDTGPSGAASTRGQRGAKVAGAVTSRTAGWMVAAALAGSLVTLLLNGGASQTATGQVAVRNVGRTALAPPGGRMSWRIAATPLSPNQVYAAPSGPLAGAVAPACAFPGPGLPPRAFRHARSITIYGRQRVVIGKKGRRASWTVIGRGPARKQITMIRPACQMLRLRCGGALGVRIGRVPAFKRIMIKRRARIVIIGPGGRPQRRFPSCAVYVPAGPAPGR